MAKKIKVLGQVQEHLEDVISPHPLLGPRTCQVINTENTEPCDPNGHLRKAGERASQELRKRSWPEGGTGVSEK